MKPIKFPEYYGDNQLLCLALAGFLVAERGYSVLILTSDLLALNDAVKQAKIVVAKENRLSANFVEQKPHWFFVNDGELILADFSDTTKRGKDFALVLEWRRK